MQDTKKGNSGGEILKMSSGSHSLWRLSTATVLLPQDSVWSVLDQHFSSRTFSDQQPGTSWRTVNLSNMSPNSPSFISESDAKGDMPHKTTKFIDAQEPHQ